MKKKLAILMGSLIVLSSSSAYGMDIGTIEYNDSDISITAQMQEGEVVFISELLRQIANIDNNINTSNLKVLSTYNPYVDVNHYDGTIEALASGETVIPIEGDDTIIDLTIQVLPNWDNKKVGLSEIKVTQNEETTSGSGIGGLTESTSPIKANYFTDINHRPWAVEAINSMASKGYLKGVGNSLFKPDNNCKRCDFVIATVRMLGLKATELKRLNFKDTSSFDYYNVYLQIAVDNNVVSNTNNFRPNDYITREEAALVIYRGLIATGKIKPISSDVLKYLNYKYTDASKINDNYKTAIATLTENGLMKGTTNASKSKFEPKSKITRAQMAVLLNNVSKTIVEK